MPTVTFVRWRDAVSQEAAEGGSAKAELVELQEIGFLLDETDEALLIGMETHNDATVAPGRWRLSIPKNNIVDRRDVDLDKTFMKRRKKASA